MLQIADGVFRLGSKGHNYFIVREGDEATLIDAGCSREWGKFAASLESVGLSLDSIAGLVVTHAHADHFGLAKQLADNGVAVSVHQEEQARALGTYSGKFSAGAGDLPIFNLRMWRNFWPMLLAGVMKLEFVKQVGSFSHEERLDLPGNPVAVHTPGHTEGHTMFHLPSQGLLFTGDGLITMDLLGSATGPQMIEQRFNNDHQQAIASLDHVAGLDADLILPGHGEPWRGSPAEAVRLARG